jgi:UDP-N-acetylglucosamine acyltransferase
VKPKIHPSACVDPSAKLGEGVEIGPFAVIEAEAELGEGCIVGAHAVVHAGVRLGRQNKIFSHAAVGGDPQDLKYKGEKTRLEIGDENSIREFVTLNRGTAEGGGVTRIGSYNLFMAYSHIAHDCQVGDHVVLANSVAIGGHCSIESYAVVGGLAGLHQFARIGTCAMAGGLGRFSKDVLPYSVTAGTDEMKVYELNKIGLRRLGLPRADIAALDHAFHLYLRSSLNHTEALAALEALEQKTPQIQHLIDFIKSSKRGVHR